MKNKIKFLVGIPRRPYKDRLLPSTLLGLGKTKNEAWKNARRNPVGDAYSSVAELYRIVEGADIAEELGDYASVVLKSDFDYERARGRKLVVVVEKVKGDHNVPRD